MQVVDRDLLVGGDRDDLLREHVERVPRDPRLLDLALAHRARDDRRLEQVGAELREDAPLRRRAELVAGAADPLQAARDRLRRLDLDHEVDGAHVDAELEARRRDEARDPAGLEVLLDDDALLARERAVVRAGDLLLRELVQPQREPLGQPPVVDEDDRRAVLLDEPQHLGVDRRPDRVRAVLGAAVHLLAVGRHGLREGRRSSRARACPRPARPPRGRAPSACRRRRVVIGRPPETNRPISSSGRWVADRPIRWIGPSTSACRRSTESARCAPRLRACDRVHLVEDQRLDAAQRLARLRGEHQVERLGRRDQDVRRLLQQLAAFLLRRVAGADANPQLRLEACERAAQVALDVVVQRLQRRDVEQAQPLAGRVVQAVDRGEEGGQRLARAGRRLDQHVLAARDRRPAQHLRRRRRVERPLEPGPRRGREDAQRVHPPAYSRRRRAPRKPTGRLVSVAR